MTAIDEKAREEVMKLAREIEVEESYLPKSAAFYYGFLKGHQASAKEGWTDEDMRKEAERLALEKYPVDMQSFPKGTPEMFQEKTFDQNLPARIKFAEGYFAACKFQSLPKNPSSSEREAVMFAEFLGENNYQMQGGVWRKFNWRGAMNEKYTTSELFNSPEFKLWKEKRNA